MNKNAVLRSVKGVLSIRKVWIALLFCVFSVEVYAQYYSTGVDPASIKWSQLKTDARKIVFPNYYEEKARIVDGYLDFLTPYITRNMSSNIEKFDVILHTENTQSNGLVTWAPKRIELFMPPPSEQNSLPWIKQLVAHEYRHVVQMSNLDVGFTRVLKYVFGEQIVGVVASIPPLWFLEGDAVFMETQFAFNGRGDQPSFSMGLRALLNEGDLKVNSRLYDKWKLSSYKDFTPSYYEFGYFMTAYAYREYGDDYWKTILRYIGRNPYLITPDYFAAKKFYNTSSSAIFKQTMADLKEFWHEESQKPNSSTIFELPYKSYTTYKDPQYFNGETILARKSSFDRINRIVAIDKTSGKEKRLRYVPLSDTRMVVKDSVAYWTEYEPSVFYENDTKSVVKSAELYTKNGQLRMSRPKTMKFSYSDEFELVKRNDNLDFITPVSSPDVKFKFALVSYDRCNNPSINLYDENYEFCGFYGIEGNDSSITGLAYDEKTAQLCYIVVDDRGCTIEGINVYTSEKCQIHNSSYIVFSDLSAQDGKLYFGSTESGKDEVHVIDIEKQEQYQLTSSKYGSFAGVGGRESEVLLTTYTFDGYMVSEQKFDVDTLRKVSLDKKMPEKTVCVPTVDWNLPKLDTINITSNNIDASEGKVKKYNKTSHLFNIHSWAPAVLDVNKLIDDQQLDVEFGATVLTQNLLGSMSGYFGYGWVPKNNKSLFTASLEYSALPVHVGVGLDYGGESQSLFTLVALDNEGVEIEVPELKNKVDLDVNLSLPMSFSGGANVRALQPYVNLSLTNSLILNEDLQWMKNYDAKMKYGVSYTTYRIMATKDVAPRLGYSLLAGGIVNPFRDDFGSILNFYAKGYLPGFFQHHAFSLAGAYQVQKESDYNYTQKLLYPRGNDLLTPLKNSISTAASYKMPIVNADFIIPNVIDIKRIYVDVFGEYARCEYINNTKGLDQDVFSYGAELFFDTHFLGLSTFEFDLGVSVYKASQYTKPQIGFSFSVNY